MKRWIGSIIVVFAVAVFGYSGGKLYSIRQEYQAGKQEYRKIRQYVNPAAEESAEKTNTERIDFAALEEINPDVKGWIVSESLNISYPLVQGEDNEYYLHHTFEKKSNGCGCIFMDAKCAPDFSDFNTFLYGHNMKNGAMFGSLKKLLGKDAPSGKNLFFDIDTGDSRTRYRICSCYVAAPDSDSYRFVATAQDYQDYVQEILKKSVIDYGITEAQMRASMVTLSTCSGSGEEKKRLLVHGLAEGEEQ